MTTIRADSPVRRETAAIYRGRPLIIELHAGFASIRQKGKRTGYTVSYEAIFETGAKIRAREERAEREAEKANRRAQRRKKAWRE